jgi:outer membrane protein assembly factor BamE (lipoprotein component of BamABCDE complex)
MLTLPQEETMAWTARSLGWVVAAALVAGCTTMKLGRNFDYNTFASRVQVGTTTAPQVMDWLGAPIGEGAEVGVDGNRLDVWSYYFASGKIPSGADTSFKLLQVKFNAQGKVAAYVWSGDVSGSAPVPQKSAKK